jgi:hypothetical protein
MDPTTQSFQTLPAPKMVPALLGGLFIGILSALPFLSVANCCCLWVITGGVLATRVMQQNHPFPVGIRDGAIVGMLAGLFGGIVSYVVSIPIQMYLGPWMGAFSDEMMRGGQDMPPEVRRIMREMGPATMQLLSSLMFTAVAVGFGMLGGMIGVVFVRKPLPPPPPPPPWTPPPFQERSWPPPPPPPGDDTPPGA